jgi:hypothetical protein
MKWIKILLILLGILLVILWNGANAQVFQEKLTSGNTSIYYIYHKATMIKPTAIFG